jgi:lipid-A-disaccharide synthase
MSPENTDNSIKRVLIVAGEASGDMHAANLIREVRKNHPEVIFSGIGGTQMRAAGAEILVDSRVMAVVGLFEVLAHFRTIYGALQLMRHQLRERQPDLLILVDYPDFNLRLAKTAKQMGIKVLYYISPQIWAWRQERVHKIAKLVDRMAVVFPFEASFYEKAGVPVTFVGHPLVEEAKSDLSRDQALVDFGLTPERKTVGLFPGSRRSEIKRLLPLVVEAAKRLQYSHPDLQFLLPLASTLDVNDILPQLEDMDIKLIKGRPYDVMRACDAIVSASGTATLEIALIGTPLVVIYRIAPLSYRIMSRMIKVDHIALCNIVAGYRMVPELIQHDATAANIQAELEKLLEKSELSDKQRADMEKIRGKLGSADGAKRIAELTLEMLGKKL